MKTEESYMTNLTKLYILVLLHESPRHGYELMEELGKRTGKKPSAGQIYPLLKKLQKKNYLRLGVKKSGKKTRKVYSLTLKGKKSLVHLLAKFSGILNTIIEEKLTVCAHCKCEIYRGSYKQKFGGKILNFCCKSCAHSYK